LFCFWCSLLLLGPFDFGDSGLIGRKEGRLCWEKCGDRLDVVGNVMGFWGLLLTALIERAVNMEFYKHLIEQYCKIELPVHIKCMTA